METQKSKSVAVKTTNYLVAGDVIETGSSLIGFDYFEIVSVEDSVSSKRMRKVTVKFSHGGTVASHYGVNATWNFVKAGN